VAFTVISSTYLVGKGGSVTFGTVVLPITDWDGDHACGTFDATNATTGGNAFPEATIVSMNGGFTCVWPVTAGEPAMAPAQIAALLLKAQTGSTYSFNALCTNVQPKVDIKGGVTYTVKYMSQGAITAPTA
jgi:hypothetical protein